MMKHETISLKTARQLVLQAQMLDGQTVLPPRKESVNRIIDQLGYIQIDSISVVKRTHHLTCWTRFPAYQDSMLHDLQARDRTLFEYWGHAMSYLPMQDYRFCLPRMKNFQNPSSPWVRAQLEECESILDSVLERIRNEGPLSSRAFSHTRKTKGGWWNWKPAKVALEMLFWRGDLMIAERQNFQKVYDLTERVLPESIDTTYPGQEEIGQYLVRRAFRALGVATERGILAFLQTGATRDSDLQIVGKAVILETLSHLVESGEVTTVRIENQKNHYYSLSAALGRKQKPNDLSNSYLLSPFDNLIIKRDRIKALFDFEYALECYVPPARRKYGYFVMPVLWNGRFAGRLDPKADRKTGVLHIQNLSLEEPLPLEDGFPEALTEKIVEFAKLNDCQKIQLHRVSPAALKAELRVTLKQKSERLRL
jgi:uncharacterized protein YcaQ